MNANIFTDQKIYFRIINGPSKDRLFDRMKHQYERNDHIDVSLTISLDGKTGFTEIENFLIESLKHNDSTGENFRISGHCDVDLYQESGGMLLPYRFEAYYNAKNRKGEIALIKGK